MSTSPWSRRSSSCRLQASIRWEITSTWSVMLLRFLTLHRNFIKCILLALSMHLCCLVKELKNIWNVKNEQKISPCKTPTAMVNLNTFKLLQKRSTLNRKCRHRNRSINWSLFLEPLCAAPLCLNMVFFIWNRRTLKWQNFVWNLRPSLLCHMPSRKTLPFHMEAFLRCKPVPGTFA